MAREAEVSRHYRGEKKPQSEVLSLRIDKDTLKALDSLKSKKEWSRAKVLINLVARTQESKKRIYSRYKCFSCNQKIKKNEEYYCEMANKERWTDGQTEMEIIVEECVPFEVLCMSCAKKKRKLKIFEGNKKGKGSYVKESERDI